MIARQPNFAGIDGGRDRDRTYDPYHVKVVDKQFPAIAAHSPMGITR